MRSLPLLSTQVITARSTVIDGVSSQESALFICTGSAMACWVLSKICIQEADMATDDCMLGAVSLHEEIYFPMVGARVTPSHRCVFQLSISDSLCAYTPFLFPPPYSARGFRSETPKQGPNKVLANLFGNLFAARTT